MFDAFRKEAARDGFEIETATTGAAASTRSEREIQSGSYELYAEVLRRMAVRIAKEIGWPLEPSRSGFLPESVQRWPAFRETNPQLTKLSKKIQARAHLEHRRQAARARPGGTSRRTSTSS